MGRGVSDQRSHTDVDRRSGPRDQPRAPGPAPGREGGPTLRVGAPFFLVAGRYVLGLGLLLAVGACRDDGPVETAGSELLRMDADQVAIGVEHYLTRDGLRRARLVSDTAWFLQDSSRVRMAPVDAVFYDEEGREISDLEARWGVYDMRTNDVEVNGDVVVRARREFERLETEHLTYTSADDKLRGDVDFVLYKQGDELRGSAFISDPGLDTVRVISPSAVSRQRGGGR